VRLVCCPSASLGEVCREVAPSHVLTLSSPGAPPPTLPMRAAHLHLAFNDIAEAWSGHVPPDEPDVRRILSFGRSWGGEAPLVVSCEMGVSRSTAALFVIACDRWPESPEDLVATRLRGACPCATPNPLLVSCADRILGRQDRMIRAVAGIGRGADYAPYRAFTLRLP
jgi:predicted protein tyrosine phosphatase